MSHEMDELNSNNDELVETQGLGELNVCDGHGDETHEADTEVMGNDAQCACIGDENSQGLGELNLCDEHEDETHEVDMGVMGNDGQDVDEVDGHVQDVVKNPPRARTKGCGVSSSCV
ncbi:hypothetical protein E2542_SST06317 [Spatholobus suberectus]|nr:hypothetical protein E2542_SST06317 [Spatholobus suberectus]